MNETKTILECFQQKLVENYLFTKNRGRSPEFFKLGMKCKPSCNIYLALYLRATKSFFFNWNFSTKCVIYKDICCILEENSLV